MKQGIAIPLKYRHDHIEDAILVYTTHKCAVYLVAEDQERGPSFVKLQFDRARCVRSAATDLSPAIGIHPTDLGVSFIVELTESKWPVEADNAFTYRGSSLKPRGRHFVVSNHDVFHEILADSFSEYLVDQEGDEYEFVKRLFA